MSRVQQNKGSNPPGKKIPNHGKIQMVITDVDGVLTNGAMYYTESGDFMKRFNTRDGMGFELLIANNILPLIFTKENSQIVVQRAKKLHVTEVHIGIEDKLTKAKELMEKYQVQPENVAFIGDDINDIPLLETVGYSYCPSDAEDEVKKIVQHVCERKGGDGVFREIVNKILHTIKT